MTSENRLYLVTVHGSRANGVSVKAFGEVRRVGALLGDLRCEWFVCGGWALDLFLGRVTRGHK